MDVGRHARLDGNNASTQPQCKANALAPAAGTTDGAEDEGSDVSAVFIFSLPSITDFISLGWRQWLVPGGSHLR
jgi:hypothetical protein